MKRQTNPFYRVTSAPPFGKQHLLYALRQAAGRPRRWHRQLVRRHPLRFRPLTPGERQVRDMRQLAAELAGLLEPFRRTRHLAHEPLRPLLADADSRPVLVAQVAALRECHARLKSLHTTQERAVAAWRHEWETATEQRRRHIAEVEKGTTLNVLLRAFVMLSEEARYDLFYLEQLCPEAFAPAPAPEPWLDKATGPTPYSA